MDLSSLSKRQRSLLAVLSGILLGLSFPPFGVVGGMLAFVGLIPLLASIEHTTRLRETFRRAWLAMFVLGLVSNYWVGGWRGIGNVDPFLMLGGLLLMAVHPLFLVIPILLYDVVRRRYGSRLALFGLPIFWAGFEYWHSFGDLSYPWLSLSNTQTYNTAFIQFIEFTGPYALSMVIVAVNLLLYRLIFFKKEMRNPMIAWLGLALLLLIPYVEGMWALGEKEVATRSINVAVIQPNINPWAKWLSNEAAVMDTNYHATDDALRLSNPKPDLLLWPETAIPYFITAPNRVSDLAALWKYLDSTRVPLLTGAPDWETYETPRDVIPDDAHSTASPTMFYRSWNSSLLFYRDTNGARRVEHYHKQKLVPLGEHVPFVESLPFLGKIFSWSVGLGSWNTGSGYDVMNLPLHNYYDLATARRDSAKLWAMICYEAVYPSFVRHFVHSGAEALMIVTNDGWYGKSSGPHQLNQYSVLRAIENRRWVVRSANTGISSIVDDRGHFVRETPLFEQTSFTERIPLIDRETLYSSLGDYIAIPCKWITALLTLYLLSVWLWFKMRTEKNS
jgi:apolipoprotein N-acyltransferase